MVNKVNENDDRSLVTIVLKKAGSNILAIIRIVRSITDLGLREALLLVKNVPAVVKQGISMREANKIKNRLEEVGATVEIRFDSKVDDTLLEERGKKKVVIKKSTVNLSSGKNKKKKEARFNIVLKSIGNDLANKKILTASKFSKITGLKLAAAKWMLSNFPKTIKTNIVLSEAERIKKELLELGAVVELVVK